MRKALIVGIDHYDHVGSLNGCVNDAHSVKAVLERHADGIINFGMRILTGTGKPDPVSKDELKDSTRELFAGDPEIALFYFAGHGYIEDTGGFLCTSECRRGDDGLSLAEVMSLASNSKAENKVIILDSCHGGIAGDRSGMSSIAEIKEGMTILAASTAEQYALESPGIGAGVFTSLFVDALGGSAANLLGDVTPGSVYAHIDQSLGPWSQRPVFKTNVKSFVSLRRVAPPVDLKDLHSLLNYFPSADFKFKLDPSFEPERSQEQIDDNSIPPPDPSKNTVFAALQRLVKVNLVRPIGEVHMYHAAMNSKSCELTVLGEHYRNLVERKLI